MPHHGRSWKNNSPKESGEGSDNIEEHKSRGNFIMFAAIINKSSVKMGESCFPTAEAGAKLRNTANADNNGKEGVPDVFCDVFTNNIAKHDVPVIIPLRRRALILNSSERQPPRH